MLIFTLLAVDKASDNFVFLCREFYITKLLSELGFSGSKTSTT